MTQLKKWGHIPTPWLFDEVEMKIKGVNIFNDHKIIADVSHTLTGASNIITQINNAKRIIDCVNAMEGIIDPIAFRNQYNESKRGKLILTQEELQKLGEQYKNQEETPYIETTTGEKVHQKHTGAASEFIGLTVKREEKNQPKDAPTKADIEELLLFMKKYNQLKEVIQNMVDRLDEGGEMTLTKDSIIVFALKGAIK